ncbi:MAG: peptidase S8/S53 subtilisin kexin sedolisin, partial [Candidatus Magnetoglobus multicellularis str. Araruama]
MPLMALTDKINLPKQGVQKKHDEYKNFQFFLFVKTVVLLILFSTNILAQSTHSIMLHIHNRSFDPLQSPLLKTALSSASAATIKPRYFIVQFTSPITQKDRNMLEQMHIRVYDYIPDFAFIVRMSRDRCQMLNNTPRVRWVGPYTAPYKISQELLEHAATVSPKNLSSKTMILRVSIFPDENMADISSKLSNYGKIINTYRTHWQISFQLEISPKDIPRLSQIQGIKWISTLPSWQLMNNIASSIVNVAQVRKRFGLYGDGQVVAVCDTGLDQGKIKPESLHDDFEDGAGQSRVKNLFNLTQRFFNDNPDDIFSGHGTHVAGTILGNGYLSGSHPKMNYFPDTSYAGIAPKAQLVFQAAEDSNTGMLLGLILDLNKIFAQAYFADARIHSNSWGAATGSTYSAECADVDQFMWDNKNFLIVFAAGNSGVDMDHDGRIDPYAICSPATAKNCLTIGGSESVRQDDGYTCAWGECWPTLYAKDPIASDHLADNPDGMAAFSSRGPTIDGRFKPDLVAPSTNIISARSSKANLNGWGLTENEHYVFMGGTSMATPMASGTALLMREYLMKIGIDNPSAALIKACLLNAAVSMHPGQYKNDEQQEIPDINPNNVNGWGRLNLEKGVYPTAPISIIYKYTDLISTDETITYYFENLDSQYPIKINLVWTDYPGTPMAQGGLVNDLDFHVVGPDDQIHYPDNAMNKSVVNTLQYDTKYAFFLSDMNVCGMRFTLEKIPSFLDAVSICISNPDAIQDDIWIRVYDISEDKLPGKLRHEKKYQYLPSGWTTLPIDHIECQSREFLIAIEKTAQTFVL